MLDLKTQLSKLFNSDLYIPDDMTIVHYSYQDKHMMRVDHYESIGRTFLTLVSTHLSISVNLKEEKNWDSNGLYIKRHIINKYTNKLLLSEVYNHILFGSGVTEAEKKR